MNVEQTYTQTLNKLRKKERKPNKFRSNKFRINRANLKMKLKRKTYISKQLKK